MSFANKVILITGASSGIGAHAAIHLSGKGASVALVDRNQKQLNEVCARIKNAGSPTPFVIVADVTTDADRIMLETVEHFGKLDVLINSAGVASLNTIENIDLEEYDRIMNINVRSIVHLSKLAIPYLEETKGNILNVSSAAGSVVKPHLLAYGISKAAVDQLTKCAALHLAPKGIRVNAINPAVIETPIHSSALGLEEEQEAEYMQSKASQYPIRRVGNTMDTSNAIEYLISDSASFITGSLLAVDGGAVSAGFF